jgi:glycosyltransferase involved in cell wall biosynthesis
MGYPVLESIRSALPLVDEMVVAVGKSEDSTQQLIESLQDPKIRVVPTIWDKTKVTGGLMLSEKTNEALDLCRNDWCVYLQADELFHEDDLNIIRRAIEVADSDNAVDGVLFRYIHFYGSYQTIATNRKWYRNEVRVVRRSSGIRSHNDAQGFRVHGEKPRVIRTNARVFHYGWVKPPNVMGEKSKLLNRWWHGNARDNDFQNFRYECQYGLKAFNGTHPSVIRQLVDQQDWSFDHRRTLSDWSFKDLNLWASDFLELCTGWRIGEYRPYKIVRTL